jgi:hypothetical protein
VGTYVAVFVAVGIATSAVVYWLVIRPWHLKWGATEAEIEASIPGDHLIPEPHHVATRSVTINAQVEDVWPWLAQMGYQRGGLYAYDWICRLRGTLAGPSAVRIIPKFQRLAVGDELPMGSRAGWRVEDLQPNHLLLVHIRESGIEHTRVWVLNELDESHTRLVLRIRSRLTKRVPNPLFHLADAGSFLMTRKHLLGIKQRADIAAWQTEEWLTPVPSKIGWLPSISFDRHRRMTL